MVYGLTFGTHYVRSQTWKINVFFLLLILHTQKPESANYNINVLSLLHNANSGEKGPVTSKISSLSLVKTEYLMPLL